AQTHQRLETNPSHQKRTTRLDLTHRPKVQKRTPGLGTTPLARPTQPRLRHADFIYACSSPGEEGVARILHARS
ncbi:hypothetical protein, partial [Pseudarthrobacter sp. NamE5]|uniref:hypothetical protein n=1 Tax=Pseudarthrobacter sp. NamE5 TaxID=2576839 RepID=UPI00197B00AC